MVGLVLEFVICDFFRKVMNRFAGWWACFVAFDVEFESAGIWKDSVAMANVSVFAFWMSIEKKNSLIQANFDFFLGVVKSIVVFLFFFRASIEIFLALAERERTCNRS
jgi:hypothetical protein